MTYTDQEKATIITKYRQGKPVQELCAEYGICARTIYRWTKYYPTVDNEQFPSPKEYKLLLHRIEKLENIIKILKTVNKTPNQVEIEFTSQQPDM